MKKVKRFQDGGITINQPSTPQSLPGLSGYGAPNSPYDASLSSTATSTPGSNMNQTFNIQPSAQAGTPQGMKKGGKVSSASKRADGCAIRGKTRA